MQAIVSAAAVMFALLASGHTNADAFSDRIGIAAPQAGYATNESTAHRAWTNVFFGMPKAYRPPRAPYPGR